MGKSFRSMALVIPYVPDRDLPVVPAKSVCCAQKNREPLWPSGYVSTGASEIMTKLNQLRNFLVNTTQWATSETTVLTASQYGIAFVKGDVISIMTNIGSPVSLPRESNRILAHMYFSRKMAQTSQFPLPMTLTPASQISSLANSGSLVPRVSSTQSTRWVANLLCLCLALCWTNLRCARVS